MPVSPLPTQLHTELPLALHTTFTCMPHAELPLALHTAFTRMCRMLVLLFSTSHVHLPPCRCSLPLASTPCPPCQYPLFICQYPLPLANAPSPPCQYLFPPLPIPLSPPCQYLFPPIANTSFPLAAVNAPCPCPPFNPPNVTMWSTATNGWACACARS
eukprot:365486-Chlamydomonas_euryale.AAC.3